MWRPPAAEEYEAPARFGGIRFVRFGPSQVRAMARKRPLQSSRGARWKHVVGFEKSDLVVGHVYAALTVSARDSDAAERLARQRVRGVIDVLNFFTDLVPYCHGWLYLRGETSRSHQVVMVQDGHGVISAKRETLAPLR